MQFAQDDQVAAGREQGQHQPTLGWATRQLPAKHPELCPNLRLGPAVGSAFSSATHSMSRKMRVPSLPPAEVTKVTGRVRSSLGRLVLLS